MLNDLPTLSHEEQQKAVERIQEMMTQGISTAQAINAHWKCQLFSGLLGVPITRI